jgi:hypothetical protein
MMEFGDDFEVLTGGKFRGFVGGDFRKNLRMIWSDMVRL